MNEALGIIESLRVLGFIVHYSIFSNEHLERLIKHEDIWNKDCPYTVEAIIRNDKNNTKYNSVDSLGRSVFFSNARTLLEAASDVQEQIKKAV